MLKRRPTTKQNSNKRKTKNTNPFSFSLFTFVVILHVDVGVVIIIILFLCSKKWLLSYVPLCHENLENRFTTNPPNGIAIGLPTRTLLYYNGLEPFFPIF
jgi:hypothetical protein